MSKLHLRMAACALTLWTIGAAIASVSAQSIPADIEKNLDEIFNKRAYQTHGTQLAWQRDGEIYTILEPPGDKKGMDIVAYETATGKRSVIVSAAQLTPQGAKAPLSIDEYSWSPDRRKLLIFTNSKKVWRENTRGDYWVFEAGANKLYKLGGDAPESSLMFATFSPDGAKVAWVREHNLYVEDLASEKILQLTRDGSEDIINGTTDWVNEEEFRLRNAFRWSPDSSSIAYWQFDQSGVGVYTLINDTAAEYPTLFKYRYPQPGTTNSAVRVGIVAAAGGATQWVHLEGDARQHYIPRMEWAGNSNELLLEYLDRLQQHNQILVADAHSGAARQLFEDSDKAWVDEQPITFLGKQGTAKPDLLWISERDGWRHAYRIDRNSGKAMLLTNFQADILEVDDMDFERGWLYFDASPDDATRVYLYRARLDGSGTPERVTPQDAMGTNQYNFAPGGHFAVHRFSTFISPPRLEIVSLPNHKVIRSLVSNEEVAKKAKSLLPSEPEFFKVKVANGVTMDGFVIKPPNFDPAKKYPVLTHVYGEPAAALVRDNWQGNAGLFLGALAQQGYLVVSFDNQGTPAPKGREWRKSIYGAVGVLASAQQAQGIRQLAKERPYIDTARMGIWGHSGGGSQTLNTMFRYPGVYSTGVAGAPVPDEAHYDTIYQERYMGLPEQNVKGYHDGSPINFAEGLKGSLLIVHGSGDDNVHYQGTELLINKLVQLGKPFDFMDYPNRTHCVCEGAGTTFHYNALIARYFLDHVQAGAR